MPKWIQRVWLRLRRSHIDTQIANAKRDVEFLLVDKWIALEALEGRDYDAIGRRLAVVQRCLREFQTTRDEITQQLERL